MKPSCDREWLKKMAEKEEAYEIAIGPLDVSAGLPEAVGEFLEANLNSSEGGKPRG